MNCLYHSPVNFRKGRMESFFTCTHFCPMYGEVTLQCQNFSFMNGSDDGELSHEIWYAYHLLSIILYSIYWHPSVICVLCTDCILGWLLHYLPSLHILPFVGGCIHCIEMYIKSATGKKQWKALKILICMAELICLLHRKNTGCGQLWTITVLCIIYFVVVIRFQKQTEQPYEYLSSYPVNNSIDL